MNAATSKGKDHAHATGHERSMALGRFTASESSAAFHWGTIIKQLEEELGMVLVIAALSTGRPENKRSIP